MLTTVLYATAGLFALALLLDCLYKALLHPLCKVPGPWFSAFSMWPSIYATLTGRLTFHLHSLHQRYGPVVRVAPNEVSFIEEQACHTIHARKDEAGHIFPKNYDAWGETSNYFTHSVFIASQENHGRIRKALSPAFSERMLREHEPTISRNVDRFINAIYKELCSQKSDQRQGTLDLDEKFNWLAFDTVTEFVFGESFDCITSSEHRPWVLRIGKSWKFIAIISSMKHILAIATRLLGPTGMLQSRVDVLKPLDLKTEKLLARTQTIPTLLSIGRSLLSDRAPKDTPAT